MKPITWIIVGVIAALVALMAYSTLSLGGYKVEVCKSYQGREACATAIGSSETDAMSTAIHVACSKISSGMTESTQCQATNPTKVTWIKGR